MTLLASAENAKLPWFSLEARAEVDDFERLPQQRIDICLMCQHCADACDNCDGTGNVKSKKSVGRPKAEIDMALLRELLTLRRCNREICKALGIGNTTLKKLKKEF